MFLIARWVQIKQIFYWIQLQKEPKNCSTLTIWLICWAIYFSPLMPLQECCCTNFQTLTISIQTHGDKNFAKNALFSLFFVQNIQIEWNCSCIALTMWKWERNYSVCARVKQNYLKAFDALIVDDSLP